MCFLDAQYFDVSCGIPYLEELALPRKPSGIERSYSNIGFNVVWGLEYPSHPPQPHILEYFIVMRLFKFWFVLDHLLLQISLAAMVHLFQ